MKNNIFLSLTVIISTLASTAFGKTFLVHNNTDSAIYAYTYCSGEDAANLKFRTENLIPAGENHELKDSIFLCNPIMAVGFGPKKDKPSRVLGRYDNDIYKPIQSEHEHDSDEAITLRNNFLFGLRVHRNAIPHK